MKRGKKMRRERRKYADEFRSCRCKNKNIIILSIYVHPSL